MTDDDLLSQADAILANRRDLRASIDKIMNADVSDSVKEIALTLFADSLPRGAKSAFRDPRCALEAAQRIVGAPDS